MDLANAVIKATETKPSFKFLYDLNLPIKVRPCLPALSFFQSCKDEVACRRLQEHVWDQIR